MKVKFLKDHEMGAEGETVDITDFGRANYLHRVGVINLDDEPILEEEAEAETGDPEVAETEVVAEAEKEAEAETTQVSSEAEIEVKEEKVGAKKTKEDKAAKKVKTK